MIKVPLIEIIFRVIPEAYILLLGMHVLSHTKIEQKKLIILTTYLATGVIFIRGLPITPGMHTIISIILSIFLMRSVIGVEVIKAIKVGVAMILILSISEWINLLIIEQVLNKDIEIIFSNSISKVIYGIPSMILMLGFIAIYYCIHDKWLKSMK